MRRTQPRGQLVFAVFDPLYGLARHDQRSCADEVVTTMPSDGVNSLSNQQPAISKRTFGRSSRPNRL
jgi:hypothetical protein